MPKGDGISVKQISETHHEFRWREGGKSRRKRVKCTPEQAIQYKKIFLSKTGRVATTEKTFADLVDPYLKWAVRQKAFKDKQYVVNQLKAKFGPTFLSAFGPIVLDGYQSDLLAVGKAPATVNRHIATLKHMMTKAEEWGWISERVLQDVRRVKKLPENNKRLRYLSDDEADRLMDACQRSSVAAELVPIVTLALHTGMRQGEILTLKWNQVDMRNGLILLSDTKSGERRELPMNDTVKAIFRTLPERLDGGKVFVTHMEGPAWRTALRRAGIKDFRFHDLRHTFASRLVMRGVDLATVQSLLGHKTITMTLRYAHLSPSHRAKAVLLLDEKPSVNVSITKR
jgi:integrase